jgi:uncharacterized protein RhaS with RHS repeats
LTASGTTAYTYTSENRLAKKDNNVAMAYDSTGRLSQVYTSALTTNFDYDGAALIAERDQSTSYAIQRQRSQRLKEGHITIKTKQDLHRIRLPVE